MEEQRKVQLELESRLRQNPDDAEAHAGLGMILWQAGQAPRSLQHCLQAAALLPDDVKVWSLLACVAREAGNTPAHQRSLERLINLGTAEADDYFELAELHRLAGEFSTALEVARRGEAIAGEAEAQARLLWAQGQALYHLDRYREAAISFRQAITVAPTRPEAYEGLGILTLDQDPVKALPFFRRAAELGVDQPSYWMNLGYAANLADELEESRAAFERAIRLGHTDPELYTNLMGVLVGLGELESAERIACEALKVYPDEADVRYSAADVYRHLDQDDQAETLFRQSAAMRPDARTRRALAGVLVHSEKWEEAKELLRDLLGGSERHPALLLLTHVLLRNGENQAARDLARNATAEDSGESAGWAALGAVHLAAGDLEAADRAFEQALVSAPHDPWVIWLRDLWQERTGGSPDGSAQKDQPESPNPDGE